MFLDVEGCNRERFWHVSSGHGGGSAGAGELGLECLPGMDTNPKLVGKRSLNALLHPVKEPSNTMVMSSEPMLKVEPGIPHRRLFPLDYESAGVFEVLEKAAKPILQASEYSCLLKSVKHMLLQRAPHAVWQGSSFLGRSRLG